MPEEGQEAGGFVAERAELLLRQAQRYGLATRSDALQWLGSHFRVALDIPERKSDLQVGRCPCLLQFWQSSHTPSVNFCCAVWIASKDH